MGKTKGGGHTDYNVYLNKKFNSSDNKTEKRTREEKINNKQARQMEITCS